MTAHKRECLSGDHDARVAPEMKAAPLPEAVLAVALLKIGQGTFGVRKAVRLTWAGYECQPHEVAACECRWIIQGKVGHEWHPVVFQLPESQYSRLARIFQAHWLQQVGPVLGDRRAAELPDKLQVLRAILEVGNGKHFTGVPQPLDLVRTTVCLGLWRPERGIGTAEAKQQVLRIPDRQVVRVHFKGHDGDVRIQEEVEVDFPHLQDNRRAPRCQRDANARNVVALKGIDARVATGTRYLLSGR